MIARAALALAVGAVIALAAPARADAPGWEVRVPERLDVAAGATATLPIAIALDRGLVVSRDAPLIIDAVAGGGASLRRRRLGRADAVDPKADAPRFELAVRGDAAGAATIQLRVRMWVCGGKICRPVDVRRQTAVTVAPAPAPLPAPAPVPPAP